jgi:hypothetical protein
VPEDLSWLYAPIPPPPVVREIPLMWRRKGGAWCVRVLLDRGESDRWARYEWKDGEKLGKQDLEDVARMLVDQSDGCAGA